MRFIIAAILALVTFQPEARAAKMIHASLGCLLLSDHKQLYELAEAKKEQEFSIMFDARVASKRCDIINEEEIVVVDQKDGMYRCVLTQGRPNCLWVFQLHVKED